MNQETILVVEDNDVLREGLSAMLEIEGFTVFAAENGRAALDRMTFLFPDLILSDIAMPEMDGYGFFRAVRDRPEWLSIPFLFLTARGEREDVIAGKEMGAEDYLIKPITREELLAAVSARLSRSQQLRVAQLQQAYEASMMVLANAVEARAQLPPGHIERVLAYSLVIAEQLGWRGKRLEALRFGAILHDVGKLLISEVTLCRPGPLSASEWTEMCQHPRTGAEIIRDIPALAQAISIIFSHHERWDGRGYPQNLAGEVIPEGARIVALADALDAMTTPRPYRAAISLQEAGAEILRNSASQFDPAVVMAFQRAWEAGKIIPDSK
jgi:putative two-component system response regulator